MPEEIPEVWANFFKGLNFDLPETKDVPAVVEEKSEESDIVGSVLKISFTVRMFMNHDQLKYYMITTDQRMLNEGQMSLKEAIAKFNKRRRK